MGARILVVGEAILDLTPRGDGFVPALGGSSFNTALALGRLGASTAFAGALSRDAWGARFAQALETAGVALDLTQRCAAPMPLALIGGGPDAPDFTLYLAGTAHESALPPKTLPQGVEALHCASFHATLGVTGAATLALMREANPNVLTSFDPNVRPGVLESRDEACAAIGERLAAAHIVKASEEDLRWLDPHSAPEATARAWTELGPKLVVMTRGARGATAFAGGAQVDVASRPTTVVDTVGAGDCFTAGLLAAMAGEGPLRPLTAPPSPDALARWLASAARVASWVCTRAGCDPPWASDLAGSRNAAAL